jgi:hypothetical protein
MNCFSFPDYVDEMFAGALILTVEYAILTSCFILASVAYFFPVDDHGNRVHDNINRFGHRQMQRPGYSP